MSKHIRAAAKSPLVILLIVLVAAFALKATGRYAAKQFRDPLPSQNASQVLEEALRKLPNEPLAKP